MYPSNSSPRLCLCIPSVFLILVRFRTSQLWRYGATVSTRPFQGRNTGSIPVSATNCSTFALRNSTRSS
jgi:hypothetical protein